MSTNNKSSSAIRVSINLWQYQRFLCHKSQTKSSKAIISARTSHQKPGRATTRQHKWNAV